MKILILTNKLPYPPRDGGSIATLNMMKGLHECGNQVTCLALNTNKHPFPVNQIPEGLRKSIRFMGVACNSSIQPHRLLGNLMFSGEPYTATRFNSKDFRKTLGKLLKEEEFDIVQLEGPYPGLYLDHIRKHSHARISLRAHNVEYVIWERKAQGEKSLYRKSYLRNLARRLKRYELKVAGEADFLIPISEQDACYFKNYLLHKPMLTIPVGFNMDLYPQNDLPEKASIFFIGALDWLPNQEGLSWFLDCVFDKLIEAVPDLEFHVAGRNAPSSFVKKLKHPNITYHGEVENARAFMQSHRLMVAPLLSGSGIRVKILEGMAIGRPVVTTSTGIEGIPDAIHNSVVIADDPGLFSSRLVELLHDFPMQERMRAEARAFVDRYFDTFELSKRLSQFYKTEE